MHELTRGALAGERYRVIVSTDIGGSDPDDFQSMVHYLLYSDLFDTEGLISSPWGAGRASDILAVIDEYEKDYPRLRTWSERYPTPKYLRSITRQGTVDFAPYRGFSTPTEGSEWIIRCARSPDSRPLYLLMWGLLEDLAQALHDAPDIAGKLRVHYIGGPNKKWGPNAYAYIREHFPNLWMIENNSAYRGWFNGGDMSGCWGNDTFVQTHAAGHGALGDYFATHLGGVIKMGDTPTVAWLLRGTPEDPEQESWGGRFMPVKQMPACTLHHPVTADTPVEAFAVAELVFDAPGALPSDRPAFMLEVRGQQFEGFCTAPGECRIRFVPKETGDFAYTVHSGLTQLDGQRGVLRAVAENPLTRRDGPLTRWWSDDLSPETAEGPHAGARTVSRWRRDFLQDFAQRFDRCLSARND